LKKYPVTVKDSDVFLHGTSSKNYEDIQSSGFLKKMVSSRNWGISTDGVCFEKWVKENDKAVLMVVTRYCYSACKHDNSAEGVILKITGKDLKKLNGKIFSDPNKNSRLLHDSEGIPIGVDSDSPILSIVVECDVPIAYLVEVKRVPSKDS
jgi:hypothetical protein